MQTPIDLTQLPVRTALADKAEDEKSKARDIVQFYLDNYSEVYQLICDKCKEVLALEVADLSSPSNSHHNGRQVITLSPKFKSHRARLDGAMGYQCACGNDNRWAQVEYEAVKHGGAELPPHDVAKIKKHIESTNYTPDIRVWRKDIITETFRVRRLK